MVNEMGGGGIISRGTKQWRDNQSWDQTVEG